MNMDLRDISGKEVSFSTIEIERLRRRTWILSYIRPGGIGAELGVFRGHFSVEILRIAKPAQLYLVDPWTLLGPRFNWSNPCSEYLGGGALTTAYALADTKRRVGEIQSATIVHYIEDYSLNWLQTKAPQLDFVYIDSSHSYEATLAELAAVDSVLAESGMILGDDWAPDPASDFVATTSYTIVACGPGYQWCITRHRS
jgi:hypothetical protein